MASYQLEQVTGEQLIIDDNASLADGARAAADYDNGVQLDIEAIAYLKVQFDAGPPAAGDSVAELYVLPGDCGPGLYGGNFPEGGDAGLGTDDDPQQIYLVAVFETINPSTTVDEILGSLPFDLYPCENRFVLKNTSGQTMDSTWHLTILPYRRQVT